VAEGKFNLSAFTETHGDQALRRFLTQWTDYFYNLTQPGYLLRCSEKKKKQSTFIYHVPYMQATSIM